MLPGADTPQSIMVVAGKILQEIEKPFQIEGHDISISASIGIAIYPEHGDDVRSIMKHADQAMYRAKQGSGTSIVMYEDMLKAGNQAQQEMPY